MLFLIKLLKNPICMVIIIGLACYGYGKMSERNACKLRLFEQQQISIQEARKINEKHKKEQDELFKQFENRTYLDLQEVFIDYNKIIK